MRFHQAMLLTAISVLVLPQQLAAQQAESGELSAQRVASAINQGVRYLKREQNTGGYWTRNPQHRGGIAALVTLSLLNSGVPPDDRAVTRAISYLDGLDLERGRVSVYSVSLMTMVYCMADPDSRRQRIRECVEYLTETQVMRGGNDRGGWSYSRSRGRPDASNSQFALLALHEASLIGIEVDQEVWQAAQW
ncbi:MAG: hypothetical protein ACR2NP_09105 [Pirellulaceae bacterium]